MRVPRSRRPLPAVHHQQRRWMSPRLRLPRDAPRVHL
jgi:hypothetical protein